MCLSNQTPSYPYGDMKAQMNTSLPPLLHPTVMMAGFVMRTGDDNQGSRSSGIYLSAYDGKRILR